MSMLNRRNALTAVATLALAATDALVAELRAVIADLRHDRDQWREQAQRLALPKPEPEPEPEPRTWWRWLRSTG